MLVAVAGLTACGASAPKAAELALEVVETLDVNENVKACMRAEINKFQGETLDEIAKAAESDKDPVAIAQLQAFEDSLAACTDS